MASNQILIDIILLYEKNTKKRTPETFTYLMWFINKYPTFLEHPQKPNTLKNIINVQKECCKDFTLKDYKKYINHLHENKDKDFDYI